MQYSEEKINDVLSRHKISKSTINVWKFREEIPDRYFNHEFIKGSKLENKEENSRMIIKIDSPAINKELLFEKVKVKKVFSELKKGKSTLTQEDLSNLKKEFSLLKAQIKNAVNSGDRFKLKSLLEISYLKYRPIFRDLSKTEYDRIMRFRNYNSEISKEDLISFKDCMVKFVSQL